MQFDKSQIIEMLTSQGDTGKANQAQTMLPDQVDTDRDAGMLASLGLDPQDIIAKLTGGGGGGLSGGLGKILGG